MLNINCSEECIHVKDGHCTLNYIETLSSQDKTYSDCIYYEAKNKPIKK